jgi:hypothetical protein
MSDEVGNMAAALLPTAAALMTHCRHRTVRTPTLRCCQAAATAAVAYVLFVVVVVVSITIAAAAFS